MTCDANDKRSAYLWNQMRPGDRLEELARRFGELERRLNEFDHLENDDNQYFHDELRSLGRRVGMLEKASNPGMTHFVGDDCPGGHQPSLTECGRVVVDANEWERLCRLEKAVLEFKQREPAEVTFRNAASWNAWMAVVRELK